MRGLAVMAMLAAVLAGVLAAGCGDAGPEEVVARFYERVGHARAQTDDQAAAEAERILDEFFDVQAGSGAASKEIVALMIRLSPLVQYRGMSYVLVEEGEDRALVRVSGEVVMSASGMSTARALTAEYPMVRVDGRWRISTLR